MASGCFGCIIEQPEPIAHKVRHGVFHFQLLPDLSPCLTMKAIKEACHIPAIIKITFCFQNTPFLDLKAHFPLQPDYRIGH